MSDQTALGIRKRARSRIRHNRPAIAAIVSPRLNAGTVRPAPPSRRSRAAGSGRPDPTCSGPAACQESAGRRCILRRPAVGQRRLEHRVGRKYPSPGRPGDSISAAHVAGTGAGTAVHATAAWSVLPPQTHEAGGEAVLRLLLMSELPCAPSACLFIPLLLQYYPVWRVRK